MKIFNCSSKWKTDPRAAYIPPGMALVSAVLFAVIFVKPAWSFEVISSYSALAQDHADAELVQNITNEPSSPSTADPCLPLLKSIRNVPGASTVDRNQRSAGKAAALGLVLGVRFALAPPAKVKTKADRPRLDVWQPSNAYANDRSALAVSAYRKCQKNQALKAIGTFRWAR